MKNADCIIEQFRGGKLVRTFTPTANTQLPWCMRVNNKSYPKTHAWVLSKILPTLVDDSLITTKVTPTTKCN